MTRPPGGPPAVPRRCYSSALLETFAAEEQVPRAPAGSPPLRPRLARSLALAGLASGLGVIDIGCGRGEATAHAARRGARVIAIDYSPDAVALTRAAVARSLGSPAAGRCVQVIAADATAVPVADRQADRVLLLDVVEHLHPWQLTRVLAEVRRILRPGGYVVIHTLPNRWALAVAYRLLRPLVPDLPADARSPYERVVHVNEQDPWALKRALVDAGLEARVWVEEWTTRQAAWSWGRDFPDGARARGYPLLRRPLLRTVGRALMATPLRWVAANDLFALAWPMGAPGPPSVGRFRSVR